MRCAFRPGQTKAECERASGGLIARTLTPPYGRDPPMTPQAATLLLVEDDRDIRDGLQELLQMEGYDVVAASNGQEALNLLKKMPAPACVLLDLWMPVMDGLQFCQLRRQDPQLRALPVIILSADRNVREQAEQASADGYLKKPVDLEDLLKTARKFAHRE